MGNQEGAERGPRIMVVGPPCSGKTSVVKALTNMALGTGMGWTPTVVGLDPSSVGLNSSTRNVD
jgi:polyribonucleotide 5'-hydroxyl-kinase